MSSWLPYDQARLESVLHTDRTELSLWLDDQRSLGQLAARRGFHDLEHLAVKLVQTRVVSSRMRHVLIRRARDTLTQPHLARHLLFHPFHTSALAPAAEQVFGVSPTDFVCLRNKGESPITIVGAPGGDEARLATTLTQFFTARGARAVRRQASSTKQAAALLAEQERELSVYMHRRFRTAAQQAAFAGQAGHRFGPDGDSLRGDNK